MTDETAWLIEFDASVSRVPAYYGKTDEGLGMTQDHDAAVRFSRAQDAQAVIDDTGWNAAKPVEHIWCEPKDAADESLKRFGQRLHKMFSEAADRIGSPYDHLTK